MRRRLIAALLAGALLAAPAGALAQSAGDEQYADPFGDVEQPSQNQGGSNGAPADPTDPARRGRDRTPCHRAETGTGGPCRAQVSPRLLSALLGALFLGSGVSVRRRAQPVAALPPGSSPPHRAGVAFGARRRRRR